MPAFLADTLRHLFAPDCAVCGIAPAAGALMPVCAACGSDFFPAATPRCRVCANRLPPLPRAGRGPGDAPPVGADPGAPAAAEEPLQRCGPCITDPPNFRATVALADYAAPVDAMVAALKFHNRLDLGRVFGLLLAERAAPWQGDAVLALPLAPPRLYERGYNQSEEIARVMAARLGRPLLRHALVRVRHTASQQGLRLAQRRVNVRGAFEATPAVAGRHLLLVDDVLTSGATLNEAAAALRRAGALSVTNAVVARTP